MWNSSRPPGASFRRYSASASRVSRCIGMLSELNASMIMHVVGAVRCVADGQPCVAEHDVRVIAAVREELEVTGSRAIRSTSGIDLVERPVLTGVGVAGRVRRFPVRPPRRAGRNPERMPRRTDRTGLAGCSRPSAALPRRAPGSSRHAAWCRSSVPVRASARRRRRGCGKRRRSCDPWRSYRSRESPRGRTAGRRRRERSATVAGKSSAARALAPCSRTSPRAAGAAAAGVAGQDGIGQQHRPNRANGRTMSQVRPCLRRPASRASPGTQQSVPADIPKRRRRSAAPEVR